ncbi:MAG: hypothetical protein H7840_08140 [Alphaproteobacteria bacterium]
MSQINELSPSLADTVQTTRVARPQPGMETDTTRQAQQTTGTTQLSDSEKLEARPDVYAAENRRVPADKTRGQNLDISA